MLGLDAVQDRPEQGQPRTAGDRPLGGCDLRRHGGPRREGQDRFGPGARVLPTRRKRTRPLSLTFYADIERYESTRLAWGPGVAERYIDRFVELLDEAEKAGEIRPTNTRFLAEVLRQISSLTRNEEVLRASGLSHEQAVLEIDSLMWEGLLKT